MAKTTKKNQENQKFGKCEVCLGLIPIQYYFTIKDTVTCYECKTEYVIVSKDPVVLEKVDQQFDPDEEYND